jgi:ribosomal protein S18 acetylase RimI-like enzyme
VAEISAAQPSIFLLVAYTTRRASAADIPALVEMMAKFYAESDYPLHQDWATTSFATLLRDPSLGAIWIVFYDGEPAGHVVVTVRFSMEYGGFDAFIDDPFVRPEYRRRGLGKALLNELFAECARRNVLAVHVEVAHDNVPAQALYRRCGLRYNGRQTLPVALAKDLDPG